MESTDTYRAALFAALRILGSLDALSARIRVPQGQLMRWMAGQGVPPFEVFLEVVEVLVAKSGGEEVKVPEGGGAPGGETDSTAKPE